MTAEHIIDSGISSELETDVMSAVPFMQYAIQETSYANNDTRMPTSNPYNWLAGPNCGSTSKALRVFLEDKGYSASVIVNPDAEIARDGHGLVQVNDEGERIWIDPTATQMLLTSGINQDYFVSAPEAALPQERVLIFKPDDYESVADWMAEVMRVHRQTQAAAVYAGGLLLRSPGYGKILSIEEVRARIKRIYTPDLFEYYDHDDHRYVDMYNEWQERHLE